MCIRDSYITSPILHRLFTIAERIASINIVVQLEVAERIASPPAHREYGYLSVLAQFHSRPEIRMTIPVSYTHLDVYKRQQVGHRENSTGWFSVSRR